MFTWPNVHENDTLTIDVYDENTVMSDTAIGSAKTKLKQVLTLGSMDMRLPLTTTKGKQQGFVVLRGIYRRGSMAPTAVGVVTVNPGSMAAFKQAPVSAVQRSPVHLGVIIALAALMCDDAPRCSAACSHGPRRATGLGSGSCPRTSEGESRAVGEARHADSRSAPLRR